MQPASGPPPRRIRAQATLVHTPRKVPVKLRTEVPTHRPNSLFSSVSYRPKGMKVSVSVSHLPPIQISCTSRPSRTTSTSLVNTHRYCRPLHPLATAPHAPGRFHRRDSAEEYFYVVANSWKTFAIPVLDRTKIRRINSAASYFAGFAPYQNRHTSGEGKPTVHRASRTLKA